MDRNTPLIDARSYRPDIDGLRALAVLSVIAFHAWPAVCKGAFLGVDIFFVISGYLITGIAVSDRKAGKFSLGSFYERRARRLLPALLVMLVSTMLIALVVLQPLELAALSRSVMAATTWLSNIYFWRNTGYFGEVASAQPLLHTWSLAVEEQFYLLFPLLLWIALPRGYRPRSRIVLMLACGSAVLSLWASIHRPSANFFVLPFRAWELLAGAWLALCHAREDLQPLRARPPIPCGLIGLAAVVASLVFADENRGTVFAFTLATVLGSVALLHGGRDGTGIAARMLSAQVFVSIGLISYSLYLWHQPALTLARLHFGETRAQSLMPVTLAVTAVLSWLSWRWVEQRWRRGPIDQRRRFAIGIITSTAVLFIAAFALNLNQGSLLPLTSGEKALLGMTHDYASDYRLGTCFLFEHQPPEAFKDCTIQGTASKGPSALLWGDSFAAHLWPGMAKESAWYASLRQRTFSGCAPLLDDERASDFCIRNRRFVFEEIRRRPPDHVILSARWNASHPGALQRVITALYAAGVSRVTVLGPTPLWRGGLAGWLQRATKGNGMPPAQLEPWNAAEQQETNRTIRTVAEAAGARYIDMLATACPSRPLCLTMTPPPEPALLYWDDGHLTRAGALLIVHEIAPRLSAAPTTTVP